MAYTVTCDGVLLLDTRLDGVQLLDPVVSLELNSAQAFTFALPINSPNIQVVAPLTSTIVVKRVGVSEPLFVGRVLKTTDKIPGVMTYLCEGDLAYLADTARRPYSFSGAPEDLLNSFLIEHNTQAPTSRQLGLGTVDVVDPNGFIVRANQEYTKSFDEVMSKTAGSSLGGYLRTREGSGARVLDWTTDPGGTSSQELRFGTNLLDFLRTVDSAAVATAVLPLGAVIEGTDPPQRLTVASVNGGNDIVDATAPGVMDAFGRIVTVITWDDVTEASNLLDRAQTWLETGWLASQTLELSAVDLSLLDASVDSFDLGDLVHVIADPLGVDVGLRVVSMSVSLLNPSSTKITLGGAKPTLTDATSGHVAQAVNDALGIVNGDVFDLSNRVDFAQATADGKNVINYGAAAPDTSTPGRPGDLFWVRTGDLIVEQYLCTAGNGETFGNVWVAQEMDGATLANLDAGRITVGTLTGDRLAGNAIDGMTITGATIQTSATATTGGVIMDASGINAYGGDGAVSAAFDSVGVAARLLRLKGSEADDVEVTDVQRGNFSFNGWPDDESRQNYKFELTGDQTSTTGSTQVGLYLGVRDTSGNAVGLTGGTGGGLEVSGATGPGMRIKGPGAAWYDGDTTYTSDASPTILLKRGSGSWSPTTGTGPEIDLRAQKIRINGNALGERTTLSGNVSGFTVGLTVVRTVDGLLVVWGTVSGTGTIAAGAGTTSVRTAGGISGTRFAGSAGATFVSGVGSGAGINREVHAAYSFTDGSLSVRMADGAALTLTSGMLLTLGPWTGLAA